MQRRLTSIPQDGLARFRLQGVPSGSLPPLPRERGLRADSLRGNYRDLFSVALGAPIENGRFRTGRAIRVAAQCAKWFQSRAFRPSEDCASINPVSFLAWKGRTPVLHRSLRSTSAQFKKITRTVRRADSLRGNDRDIFLWPLGHPSEKGVSAREERFAWPLSVPNGATVGRLGRLRIVLKSAL